MPGFKTNVKDYQAIAKTIKQKAFKEKAQDIIDLYVAKKSKTAKRQEMPYSRSANHVTNDLVRQR